MSPRRLPAPNALVAAAALAAGGLASCGLPQIDAMPRYGKLQLDGGLGISAPPVSARADLGAMGLGGQEDAYGARVDLKWGVTHVVVEGQQSSHEGSGALTAAVSGGGVTIPAGVAVSSQLDLGLASGLVLFDLLPGGFWELAAGLGVGAVEVDARVQEQSSGQRVTTREVLPFPLAAGVVGVQLGSLEVAVLGKGLSGTYGGDRIDLIDLDAFVRWRLLGGARHVRGSLAAGYRVILFDAQYGSGGEDVDANLDLSGPYVGIELTL